MNWPHVHLLLNHVPVLGTIFGLALLAWGLVRRNSTLERAALVTFVLIALAAIPAYFTGGAAEESVGHIAGMSDSAIEAHEEVALLALIGIELLGAVALGTLLLARSRFAILLTRSVLALALTTTALMTWTANLGGRIRHSELQARDRSPGTSAPELTAEEDER